MGRGQSLIVWAIAEGRACAAGVDDTWSARRRCRRRSCRRRARSPDVDASTVRRRRLGVPVRNLTAMFSLSTIGRRRRVGSRCSASRRAATTMAGPPRAPWPIQPSSYVVQGRRRRRPRSRRSTEPTPTGGRRPSRPYIDASAGDVPVRRSPSMFDVSLDELRNYNGWERRRYAGFPGVGGTVRIPPGAKFIDPQRHDDDGGGRERLGRHHRARRARRPTDPASGDRCNPTYVVAGRRRPAGDHPQVRHHDRAAQRGATPAPRTGRTSTPAARSTCRRPPTAPTPSPPTTTVAG